MASPQASPSAAQTTILMASSMMTNPYVGAALPQGMALAGMSPSERCRCGVEIVTWCNLFASFFELVSAVFLIFWSVTLIVEKRGDMLLYAICVVGGVCLLLYLIDLWATTGLFTATNIHTPFPQKAPKCTIWLWVNVILAGLEFLLLAITLTKPWFTTNLMLIFTVPERCVGLVIVFQYRRDLLNYGGGNTVSVAPAPAFPPSTAVVTASPGTASAGGGGGREADNNEKPKGQFLKGILKKFKK